MSLLLQPVNSKNRLFQYYQRAFQKSVELFIVTAYLTDWNASLKLSSSCRHFRMIIGRDFGITRKAACRAVMRWLPSNQKFQFLVADPIKGFHPKAVFWKESNKKCFSIVGSSNLTQAAFKTNHEANVFMQISDMEYATAKKWCKNIEEQAIPISENWLRTYNEAPAGEGARNGKRKGGQFRESLSVFNLPKPPGIKKQIDNRRKQLNAYSKVRGGLIGLFRRCADGEISSIQFYEQLPKYWSVAIDDRLQGKGWEKRGKNSDFQALSKSYVRILDATDEDRDDLVAGEIDTLRRQHIPTRRAFLSEMLCLEFPERYPVLNQPVLDFLKAVNFRYPRGASEGSRYIDLAKRFRFSLLQNPNHPAKNLAELDTVIWLAFGKK